MKRTIAFFAALVFALSPAMAAQIGAPIGPFGGGGGGGGGSSGVSSLSTTCPASGPTTGAITLSPSAGRLVTGTTDTLVASDCGGAVEYSNASPTAVSLTAAATLGAGWCVNIPVDAGAGLVTVTSAGGNFNTTGNTTLTIAATIGTTICTNAAANGFVVSGSGTGNVSGPGSAVSGHVAVYSGTSGKILADGGAVPVPFQAISGYKSSNWYTSLSVTNFSASTAPPTVSAVYCHPFIVSSQGMTVKGIGIANSTTGAGSASFAIYKGDGTGGRPGTLIDTISASVVDSTAAPAAITGALTNTTDALLSGMNWVCGSFSDTTVRYISAVSTGGNLLGAYTGSANVTGNPGLISTSTGSNGITCAAASTCGAGFAAWSGTTFNWATFASPTWAETASSVMPLIVLQAN